MKKTFLSLLAVLALVTTPAYAAIPHSPDPDKTVLEQATATAKASVATNLNEVIVDILRGVKTAGGEVYQASKSAITKSVDFTMEQAPLVVKEFLTWKMAEAIIWAIIWSVPALTLFYLARVARKASEEEKRAEYRSYELFDKQGCRAVKWLLRCVGIFILLVSLGVNGMTITKIAVAPRVYLIEYVVSAIQGNSAQR